MLQRTDSSLRTSRGRHQRRKMIPYAAQFMGMATCPKLSSRRWEYKDLKGAREGGECPSLFSRNERHRCGIESDKRGSWLVYSPLVRFNAGHLIFTHPFRARDYHRLYSVICFCFLRDLKSDWRSRGYSASPLLQSSPANGGPLASIVMRESTRTPALG